MHRRRASAPRSAPNRRNGRKPDWVVAEVLRLKALMRDAGVRKIAASFNRLHGPSIVVGKTFVADTIRDRQYELACITRDICHRPPRPVSVNAVWGIDLTFHTDQQRVRHAALGIIDHGSRLLLTLEALQNKCAWTLLGHLFLAFGKHGKPRALRSDNEAVFTSVLFRTVLRLAGIRHQRTQLASPWQNPYIERLFGTLKPLLRRLVIPDGLTLRAALLEFTLFYNHVRPHQNLGGATPAEAWNGVAPHDQAGKHALLVEALDGLLVGYRMHR